MNKSERPLYFQCKRCHAIISDHDFMEYGSAIHAHLEEKHKRRYGYLCEVLDEYAEVENDGYLFCLL